MSQSAGRILSEAVRCGYAVPHFNVNSLECEKCILQTAERLRSPVIVAVTGKGAEAMGGFAVIEAMTRALVDHFGSTIPVVLHLDHGTLEEAYEAADAGFDSVMFDGSALPFRENLERTRELAVYCMKKGISLEAEAGSIGRGTVGGEIADPTECGELIGTGITMLAVGIGNMHGRYPDGWKGLNFNRLQEIRETTGDFPLVLHGGSGIPEEQIRKAIGMGIAKINVNTECQVAFMNGVRSYIEQDLDRAPRGHFLRNLFAYALRPMEAVVEEKIRLCGAEGKAEGMIER